MNPRVAEQTIEQLRAYLQRGNLAAGMPSFADLPAADRAALARYLLGLNVETIMPANRWPMQRGMAWGRLNPATGSPTTANSANRYSELRQINTANVAGLQLKWIFPIPHFGLEVTPLEAAG